MRTQAALGTLGAIVLACTLACQREVQPKPDPAGRPSTDTASSGADASRTGTSTVARPPPTRVVGGTVAFSGGVARAQVCAWWRSSRVKAVRDDVARRCTMTDAAGHYALELPAGVWLLVASTSGHLPDSEHLVLREGQPNASLDFVLRRGGSARAGTIVDLEGAPVAGVWVDARVSLEGRPGIAGSAQTNAEGHFELWAPDDASLEVNAPGYIGMVASGLDTYTVLPESVIAGRVIDEAGKPVAGARVVYVERWDPPLGVPEHATLTDAEGRFRLANVAAGNYKLMVFRERLGAMSRISLEFAQVRADIEIVVKPSLEWLRAQVVEASGEPVAGCLVGLMPADDEHAWGYTFWTDEEGGLNVPTSPGKRFEVDFFNCPSRIGTPPYDPLVSGRPDGEVDRLEVAPGHLLRGRMVAADGQPLADVKVSVSTPEAEVSDAGPPDSRRKFMTLRPDAATDADGRFEIAGLFPGELEVQVEGRSRSGSPLYVTVTDQPTTEASFAWEIDPEPQPQASLGWPKTVVHVVDPARKSVAKAVVRVTAGEARLTSTNWWSGYGLELTDAHGRASFERGCDPSWPCTVAAVRPGMFGVVTLEPGHLGEVVVVLRPSQP